MQSKQSSQFLNITFYWFYFALASTASVFTTVIVPLTSMYASPESHKLDFNIEVLNLIWHLCYTLRVIYCLPDLLFFDIPFYLYFISI